MIYIEKFSGNESGEMDMDEQHKEQREQVDEQNNLNESVSQVAEPVKPAGKFLV